MVARTVAGGSTNASFRQQKIAICKEIILRVVAQYFPDTLGTVTGIEDIYVRIMSKESSLNENIYIANFRGTNWERHINNGTPAKAYRLIRSLRTGDTTDGFIREVVLPHGVGQVMGYHMVRNFDGKAYRLSYKGKDVFDLVTKKNGSSFLVDANASIGAINANFQGPDALENGIRAGIAVLANKYDKTKDIRRAIVAYHGGGQDTFGTNSNTYANEMLNGTGHINVASPNSKPNIQIAQNLPSGTDSNSNNAAKSKWSCTA